MTSYIRLQRRNSHHQWSVSFGSISSISHQWHSMTLGWIWSITWWWYGKGQKSTTWQRVICQIIQTHGMATMKAWKIVISYKRLNTSFIQDYRNYLDGWRDCLHFQSAPSEVAAFCRDVLTWMRLKSLSNGFPK